MEFIRFFLLFSSLYILVYILVGIDRFFRLRVTEEKNRF